MFEFGRSGQWVTQTTERAEDYYEFDLAELKGMKLTDLTEKRDKDIYVMRNVKPELEAAFTEQLTPNQRYYRENGYVILKNVLSDEIIQNFMDLRDRLGLDQSQAFPDFTPFVEHDEVRKVLLHPEVVKTVNEIQGQLMGLTFILSKLKSSQRGWHPDSYLDPMDAVPRCGVWYALGDITPDVGPFQFIPGSHRWPALSNVALDKLLKKEHRLNEKKAGWGHICEAIVDPLVEKYAQSTGAEIKEFLAEKGDVLIWYGRLYHRGSPAYDPDKVRHGVIGHFAPLIEKRAPIFKRYEGDAHYVVPIPKSASTFNLA